MGKQPLIFLRVISITLFCTELSQAHTENNLNLLHEKHNIITWVDVGLFMWLAIFLLLTERLEIAIRTLVFNLRLGEVDVRMEDFVQEVLEPVSEVLVIQTEICDL